MSVVEKWNDWCTVLVVTSFFQQVVSFTQFEPDKEDLLCYWLEMLSKNRILIYMEWYDFFKSKF